MRARRHQIDAMLGTVITAARKHARMSRERFAQALKVSVGQIRNYETGKSEPGATRLAEIAAVTRTTLIVDGRQGQWRLSVSDGQRRLLAVPRRAVEGDD